MRMSDHFGDAVKKFEDTTIPDNGCMTLLTNALQKVLVFHWSIGHESKSTAFILRFLASVRTTLAASIEQWHPGRVKDMVTVEAFHECRRTIPDPAVDEILDVHQSALRSRRRVLETFQKLGIDEPTEQQLLENFIAAGDLPTMSAEELLKHYHWVLVVEQLCQHEACTYLLYADEESFEAFVSNPEIAVEQAKTAILNNLSNIKDTDGGQYVYSSVERATDPE